MSRNFLIGESLTTPDGKREEIYRQAWKECPYKYVEAMRQLPSFSSTQDLARLNQICVTWDACQNLLPPNFAGDKWEYNWARLVAKFIYDRLIDDYDIVYVAGRRSAEAFGLKKVPFCMPCTPRGFRKFESGYTNGMPTFVPIPSPSQNSKWWYNEVEVIHARCATQNLNKRISLGV